MNWQNQTILLTGGTGSFGQAFTNSILKKKPQSLRIFDSDEYAQFETSRKHKKKNLSNILGSQNVIDCAIDLGVNKVLLISSDKAVSPTNLYGATKMVAEKIFVQANSYNGGKNTFLSVV